MRGDSHRAIAKYLAKEYLGNQPKHYIRAFLLGAIEPDRNPATYLKGSLRCQWLRGHNYANSIRYLYRLSRRLDKEHYTVLDYYALGKLIHYTADAFTYAHNASFPKGMDLHREYERQLQDYFLPFVQTCPHTDLATGHSIIHIICSLHREYSLAPSDVERDSDYIVTACRSVFRHLAQKNCRIKKHIPSCNIPPQVV